MLKRLFDHALYNSRCAKLSRHATTMSPTFGPNCRVPILEELSESLVIDDSSIEADKKDSLKNYKPPLLMSQIESSLCSEFNRRIMKTDWNQYEDPLLTDEVEQAARFIEYTLISLPKESMSVEERKEWIKKECLLMTQEIESGDFSRWRCDRFLEDVASEEQKSVMKDACDQLGANPSLHPMIKEKIIMKIKGILRKTIK